MCVGLGEFSVCVVCRMSVPPETQRLVWSVE